MESLLKAIKHYLEEIFGLKFHLSLWEPTKNLPFILLDLYEFYTITLPGKECLLMVALESDAISPGTLRKHIDLLNEIAGMPCIYASASCSSYSSKRLIEKRVQFIIPNQRIYLPALGIDWLESYEGCKKHLPREGIAPSTQAVVIYALMHQEDEFFIPLHLAKALFYSPMTMTRALNEFESFKLGKIVRKGKERQLHVAKNRLELWTKAMPHMGNPVSKRFLLKANGDEINQIEKLGILAGLSALSKRSMLAGPTTPVYAVSQLTWKQLEKLEQVPHEEDATIEIEVWSYDPGLFATGESVDPFSLYLSLQKYKDERIETALEELMGKIKW